MKSFIGTSACRMCFCQHLWLLWSTHEVHWRAEVSQNERAHQQNTLIPLIPLIPLSPFSPLGPSWPFFPGNPWFRIQTWLLSATAIGWMHWNGVRTLTDSPGTPASPASPCRHRHHCTYYSSESLLTGLLFLAVILI